jgi:hypothetical protein
LKKLAGKLSNWQLKPAGTEGYRTAEVTLGGIDTDGTSSKTMECKDQPGLYFIGEALDVRGIWAVSIFSGPGPRGLSQGRWCNCPVTIEFEAFQKK